MKNGDEFSGIVVGDRDQISQAVAAFNRRCRGTPHRQLASVAAGRAVKIDVLEKQIEQTPADSPLLAPHVRVTT